MSFENLGFDKIKFSQELKALPHHLKFYLLNPVQEISRLPDYTWPTLFLIQGLMSLISGVALGVVNISIWDFILGITLFPVISVVITLVLTTFIYYYFSSIHKIFLEIHKLYTIVVFAHIPYMIFHAVSGYLPPIDLIGFAIACILITVGMHHQFSLQRKLVSRLMLAVFIVFFSMWSISRVRNHMSQPESTRLNHPQNLDQIEQDLKSKTEPYNE